MRNLSLLGLTLLLAACGGAEEEPDDGGGTPSLSLTAPANYASNLTGVQTISATAVSGTVGVEFQLDGATLGSEDTVVPYAVDVDTSLYPAGQHIIRARTRNAAGQRSAWASATVSFGGSATLPQGFSKNESWVSGLNSATAFTQAPDGRFFVAEQGGAVRVVKNGALLAGAAHQLSVDATGERGLIGLTVAPDFASSGRLYVHYTSPQGGAHNRISRILLSNDVSNGLEDTDLGLPIELPNLSGATNHNGGALHFGVDGKLYIGVGDNANGAQAANLSSVFGKLLRVNADGTIPSDNPFYASQAGLARAVWAYGLRNPFTFAVQPVTGRIHINDVGQNTWEEINQGVAAANYGWPNSEGPDGLQANHAAPLFSYKHSAANPAGSGPGGFFTGFSIAGGTFYPTNGAFPASYRGNYYFADYVSRFIARLDLANGNAAYAFARVAGNPVDMLVGQDGALYVLTRSAITRISAN